MKIGVLFPPRFEDPGDFLADARAIEAAGVDSIWLEETTDGVDAMLALSAIAAVTLEVRLGLISGKPPIANRIDSLQQLSRGRVVPSAERWRRVKVPADRDDWAATVQHVGDDKDGILVPMDPRLLDILRHPEDAVDRSDLALAQG